MRALLKIAGFVVLLGALCAWVPEKSFAGVDVGVNINLGPPPIVVPEPPAVVLVPQSRVFFVPGVEFDVFFYNGYWWSPRGDRWYRARAYDGPWRGIARRHVPAPVFRVPHDYRARYAREQHIPYGQWKKGHNDGRGRDHDHGDRGRHHERDDYRGHGEHGGRGEHGHGR